MQVEGRRDRMVRGLYVAGTGMNVQAKRMDIISNDLANVNTVGYKKDVAVVASFPEILTSRLRDSQNQIPNDGAIGTMTFGAKVDGVYTQFVQGSIRQTTSQTDLAIQGDGFFAVNTPAGVCYTRDGSFIINNEGMLMTQEGYNVMGENGPIELGETFLEKGGQLTIVEDGEISIDGELIDKLQLTTFENKESLTKIADNLYQAQGGMVPFTGSVAQGFLEMSNVNSVTAMVDMITVSRAYEANQKVIQTQDSLLGKAVNELGRA